MALARYHFVAGTEPGVQAALENLRSCDRALRAMISVDLTHLPPGSKEPFPSSLIDFEYQRTTLCKWQNIVCDRGHVTWLDIFAVCRPRMQHGQCAVDSLVFMCNRSSERTVSAANATIAALFDRLTAKLLAGTAVPVRYGPNQAVLQHVLDALPAGVVSRLFTALPSQSTAVGNNADASPSFKVWKRAAVLAHGFGLDIAAHVRALAAQTNSITYQLLCLGATNCGMK